MKNRRNDNDFDAPGSPNKKPQGLSSDPDIQVEELTVEKTPVIGTPTPPSGPTNSKK